MHTNEILKQLAIYLKVVHGIIVDIQEDTCHDELQYYIANLHDAVLLDAWGKYVSRLNTEKMMYKNHFTCFRKRLAWQRQTIKPFYAIVKSLNIDFRQRANDEKIHLGWF